MDICIDAKLLLMGTYLSENETIYIHENDFENVILKVVVISARLQCVKPTGFRGIRHGLVWSIE